MITIKLKHLFIAALALGALVAAPMALAADLTDIGYIDQAAVGNLPDFQRANAQLGQYKAGLDRQFASRMKSAHSQADQQKIISEFQGKLADKQRQVLGPLLARAQTAIASVSSSKNLSVIVDKRIVIFGGQNITKDVTDLLGSPGQIVPPVSSPAPSEVGYVDQSQIDQLPKLKAASDAFGKFVNDQRTAAQQKMARAKTDAERSQILKDYQTTRDAKQKSDVQPLVDSMHNAMAQIAKKKNLILIIDRGDLIYGGTDITTDVQNALK